MKFKEIFVLLTILLLFNCVNAYTSSGNAFYCNSCEDCIAALNDNRHDTVYLEEDITVVFDDQHGGSCIKNPKNFTNKIFDCQYHEIKAEIINSPQHYWIDSSFDGIRLKRTKEYSRSGNTIKNCIISGFDNAINMRSDSNVIANNVLNGNNLFLEDSKNNKIINNTLRGEDYRISNAFIISNSDDNLISDNIASDCYPDCFSIDESSNNLFINNIVSNASEAIGFLLYDAHYNKFESNIAYDLEFGFGIDRYSSFNTLSNNLAYSNRKAGFYLFYAEENKLFSNTANDNYEEGFLIVEASTNNTFEKNIACGNSIQPESNKTADFRKSSPAYYHNNGVQNTCDSVYNWNDEGTTGCTYSCSGIKSPTDATSLLPEIELKPVETNFTQSNFTLLDDLFGIFDSEDESDYEKEVYEPDCSPNYGRFIIATSFNRLCEDNDTCDYRDAVYNLKDVLTEECYTVEIIDFNIDGNWDNYYEARLKADNLRPKVLEAINEFGTDTYLFILGDYDVIPPCVYKDETKLGIQFSFFETAENSFLSDNCYGTTGDGISELVVSRLPTTSDSSAITYLNKMAEFHNSSKIKQLYGDVYLIDQNKYYLLYSGDQYLNARGYSDIDSYQVQGETLLDPLFSSGQPDRNTYPVHYYMLHGSLKNTRWIDDQGTVGVTNADIIDRSFVVLSLACYGGSLYTERSIPYVWLYHGFSDMDETVPNVVIGSSHVSHFGRNKQLLVGSDILFKEFHNNLNSGINSGYSLHIAKYKLYNYEYDGNLLAGFKDFVSSVMDDPKIEAVNKKVALEYQLYGDPLLTKKSLMYHVDGDVE